jgi:hypothetical protein
MPTRRQFVASCTKFAVAASMLPAAALSAPVGGREISLEQISFMDFASKLNSRFSILSDSRPLAELQLVAARLLSARGPGFANRGDEANEKFSLLFAGAGSSALESAIYKFEHAGLGRFEMFISPVGAGGPERCFYEAVFNRPAPRNHPSFLADARNRDF